MLNESNTIVSRFRYVNVNSLKAKDGSIEVWRRYKGLQLPLCFRYINNKIYWTLNSKGPKIVRERVNSCETSQPWGSQIRVNKSSGDLGRGQTFKKLSRGFASFINSAEVRIICFHLNILLWNYWSFTQCPDWSGELASRQSQISFYS